MTRLMQKDENSLASVDVYLASSRFPSYKIGANNEVLEIKEDSNSLSMKDMVARETASLLEQQKQLSVRDLACKFEKGLVAAAKLTEEARLKEAVLLEKHVLLKKLKDALDTLRGRVAGKNREDVDEALVMVEALAVQLNKREEELVQEKTEVKMLSAFLKEASEDAKKLVDEERAYARAEIESAKAAVQRVEEALQQHERMSRATGIQNMEELMREVQEARRIKMLHQPSKVMDMELELKALRIQLAEKSKRSLQLQKELARSKKADKSTLEWFDLDGSEALGSCLQIRPCSDNAPELSKCIIQWYRVASEGEKELISGANKAVYAPEPFDVGQMLQVDISNDRIATSVLTSAPIEPASGLGNYVEALARRPDTEFKVVIIQTHEADADCSSPSIHILHIGKMGIKLRKGKSTIVKEFYPIICSFVGREAVVMLQPNQHIGWRNQAFHLY